MKFQASISYYEIEGNTWAFCKKSRELLLTNNELNEKFVAGADECKGIKKQSSHEGKHLFRLETSNSKAPFEAIYDSMTCMIDYLPKTPVDVDFNEIFSIECKENKLSYVLKSYRMVLAFPTKNLGHLDPFKTADLSVKYGQYEYHVTSFIIDKCMNTAVGWSGYPKYTYRNTGFCYLHGTEEIIIIFYKNEVWAETVTKQADGEAIDIVSGADDGNRQSN